MTAKFLVVIKDGKFEELTTIRELLRIQEIRRKEKCSAKGQCEVTLLFLQKGILKAPLNQVF